jgi:predicted SnoaL-like aldol condensation-catalyzing enzyme
MIELVDPKDSRAVRNKNTVLTLYEQMVNVKKSEEATARLVSRAYIQHNPLIPDGPEALGKFFGKITQERARARVVVNRIIAVGDYVWAHVNFLNLFNGPVARAEHPARESARNVLSGRSPGPDATSARRRYDSGRPIRPALKYLRT